VEISTKHFNSNPLIPEFLSMQSEKCTKIFESMKNRD